MEAVELFLSALRERLKTQDADEVLSFCNGEDSCVGWVAASGVKAATAGDNVELALIVHTYFAQKLDENLTALDKTVNTVLAYLGERHETSAT